MTMYIEAPRVTLISEPQFYEPAHLVVEQLGYAQDGELLAEYAGRICYMSQHNPAKRTTAEYLTNIKRQGHGSVLEHANYSLLLEGVSRSLTHEQVRHRAGFAYSQVSQRYVDEEDCAFVVPPAILAAGGTMLDIWKGQMFSAQATYIALSNMLFAQYAHIEDRVHRRKVAREAARGVLPNSTETKIIVTANGRAWRTVLELRLGEGAEWEIRRLYAAILPVLQRAAPAFFDDIELYTLADGSPAGRVGYHKV